MITLPESLLRVAEAFGAWRLSDLPTVRESELRANVVFLLSPVFLDNPNYCFHLLSTFQLQGIL